MVIEKGLSGKFKIIIKYNYLCAIITRSITGFDHKHIT